MSDEAKSKKATLTETDIKTSRGIGRRAFLLGTLGGTTALAGCVTSGITDSDSGYGADPAGGGRGTRYRVSGITDSDTGYGADLAGNGRGRRSCTHSDAGPFYTDAVGRGRHC